MRNLLPSPRPLLALLAVVFLGCSQTSCGVINHNIGRLMRIPASVLSEESGDSAPGVPATGAALPTAAAPSPDPGPPAPNPAA